MSNTTSSGMGCAGVLTLIFIVLKLTGVIDWSWIWVLAPSWIPVLFFIFLFFGMAMFANKRMSRRYNRRNWR